MIIRVDHSNVKVLALLANKLWREDSVDELLEEMTEALDSEFEESFLYVDNESNNLGFVQLSIRRDYVEGCDSSPVAYLEGIYVEEAARGKGIARELVDYAEMWGRSRGCSELGSDCELENILSIDFHKGIGFEEVNRLVCFTKNINR